VTRRRGLGSGLNALIPDSGNSPAEAGIRQLALTTIRVNRSQPRTYFDPQALEELADSIRTHGLIQPVIVSEESSGDYELIAGERRLRAAQLAGLDTIPAIVKQVSPQQLLELALVENVQRADLNPLEEGQAYQTLKEEFNLTDDAIARRVGKSRVAIVNTRRLIKLVGTAQQALLDGSISAGHGRAILRFADPADQERMLNRIVAGDLSVRDVERVAEICQQEYLLPAARAAFLEGLVELDLLQQLLRLDQAEQQSHVLDLIQTAQLDPVDVVQMVDLLAAGYDVSSATALVDQQNQAPQSESAPAPVVTPEPQRSLRRLSPEDAEIQHMFEVLLATPVQVTRSGKTIRLSITLYDDEQLQAVYDRLRDTA
jgi:ParB family chromosome partitioning protein